jgi:hypothetical protein
VELLPEDTFNFLEMPERFHDHMHLNQPGLDLFTETLARRMPALLGAPLQARR